MVLPQHVSLLLIISALITIGLCAVLFCIPFSGADNGGLRQVLLTIPDCYNDLPTRGFVFVGIAVVLAMILYAFNIHLLFSEWAKILIPTDAPWLVLFFFVALATSFSTEVLSNTAVQLSFFLIALPLADKLNLAGLDMLLLITLGSTSAFMSPIATGVNGLAFGGVRGVSFSRMLLVGCVMNVAGAVLLSAWIRFVVGPLYQAG
jgi:sodium-dependent dicarboxylate transporter 2/3/5